MDKIKFQEHIELLYSSWVNDKKQHLWKNSDILAIYIHPNNLNSLNSVSFFNWLFGCSFTNILMVLTRNQIHIVCIENDKDVLQPLEKLAVLNHEISVKKNVGKSLTDNFNDILIKVYADKNTEGMVLGHIEAEASYLSKALKKKVEKLNLVWKDVNNGFLKVINGDDSEETKADEELYFESDDEELLSEMKNIVLEEEKKDSKNNDGRIEYVEDCLKKSGGDNFKDTEVEKEKKDSKTIDGGIENVEDYLKKNGGDDFKHTEVDAAGLEKEKKDSKDTTNESDEEIGTLEDYMKRYGDDVKEDTADDAGLKKEKKDGKKIRYDESDEEFVLTDDRSEFNSDDMKKVRQMMRDLRRLITQREKSISCCEEYER